MTSPLRLEFGQGCTASAVEVTRADELPSALATLGLRPPRPTVVLVGGAGGLGGTDHGGIGQLFESAIVPVIAERGAVGVDGGTCSGVMRLFGEARSMLAAAFPLVGVVAAGTVQLPDGRAPRGDAAVLEPHHTHFLIVPGDEWGAEAPWIAETATVLAGEAPSVTVLINGGEIAYTDVERSLRSGRRVVVIAGSGRTADVLAGALAGASADKRAMALVRSGLIHSISVNEAAGLADWLSAALGESA